MRSVSKKISLTFVLIFLLGQFRISAQLGGPGVGPCPYCMGYYWNQPCNQPNISNDPSNWINDFIHSFNTTGALTNIVNNNTGCNAQNLPLYGGVVNYYFFPCASKYLQVTSGQNITCNFQSGITFAQGFALFVDWNNDGIFAVTGERMVTTAVPTAGTFISGNFIVPAVLPGKYRMRVRCAYATPGNQIDACSQYGFGEIEDYTLWVGTVGACATSTMNAIASANSPLCPGQTLNLSVTYTSGTIPTFTWNGPNGFVNYTQNPSIPLITPAGAGIYSVTLSDGCNPVTKTVNVVVNPQPTVTPSSSAPLCSIATLTLFVNPAVSYTWAGPLGFSSNLQNPTVFPPVPGNYTVTVTNAFGCTNTAVTNVSVISTPTATASNNGPICPGNNLIFSGGGGGTYNWTGPNGYTASGQFPVISNAQPSVSGTYSLVVAVGACTNITTTSVTIYPKPTPTATSNSPVCLNKQLNLFGSGGVSYSWSGPNGFASAQQNPVIASAQLTHAGIYTLTVTSANNCTNTATVTVVVNSLPTITVNNPTVCLNQPINLTASGGTAYAWNGPLGFSSTLQNPTIPNAQLNMSGNYSVVATSPFGCTNIAVASVTVLALPVPGITSNTPCVGQTLNLTGSGGGTYSWTGPNGFTSSLLNPNISNVTLAANGIYSLLVTVGSCTNSITASVTVNALPTPSVTSNSPVCLLKPIIFTGSGGTTYTWTGPGSYVSNQQSPTISIAQFSNSGTYTLTVSSAQGCTSNVTTNVVVNGLPSITVNNPLVCVNQAINLTATGGTAYAWSGPLGYTSGQQNPVIANAQVNMSGGYTVVATSVAGCTSNAVANVTVIALPQPTATSNSPICVGANLNLNGSGGSTYSWSGPNGFTSSFQNPAINNVTLANTGTYSLIVTAGTCSNVTTVNVTINPLPTPTITSNSPVCLLQPINFSGGGGTTYTWTGPGFTSNVPNPVIAAAQFSNGGTYVLTVTNGNGCTNSVTTNVTINSLPVIAVNGPTVCQNQSINLTATGGTAYAWSGPSGFSSVQQNPTIPNAQLNMSGGYTVVVTSAQGCTNNSVATVSVLALPR
jgi:hypothetical protein